MRKILALITMTFVLAFHCRGQDSIAITNSFNAIFTVQTKSGTDPNFSITGTLSNSSGKFLPLQTTIDTGDYCICEYVNGSTRFTGTFYIAGITPVSGAKVTLSLVNKSGRSIAVFPNGPCAIVRPIDGLLPEANDSGGELRTSTANHNVLTIRRSLDSLTEIVAGLEALIDSKADTASVLALEDSIEAIMTDIGFLYTGLSNLSTGIANVEDRASDLESLGGVPQGNTNLGTFTGSTIPDNRNIKQAFQSLETAHESLDGDVTNLESGKVDKNSAYQTINGSLYVIGGLKVAKDTITGQLRMIADSVFFTGAFPMKNGSDTLLCVDPATGRLYFLESTSIPTNSFYTIDGTILGDRMVSMGDEIDIYFGTNTSSYRFRIHQSFSADSYIELYADSNRVARFRMTDPDITVDSLINSGSPGYLSTYNLVWDRSTKKLKKAAPVTNTNVANANLQLDANRSLDINGHSFTIKDGVNNYIVYNPSTGKIEPAKAINSSAAINGTDITATDDLFVQGDSAKFSGDIILPNIGSNASPTKAVTYNESTKKLEISDISGGSSGDGRWSSRASKQLLFDDFLNSLGVASRWGELGWTYNSSGSPTAPAFYTTFVSGRPGILQLKGHTTNAFVNDLTLGTTATTTPTHGFKADGDFTFEAAIMMPNVISADGEVKVGLISGTWSLGIPTDGLYFQMGGAAGSATGRGVFNGASTSYSSTFALSNNTWYKLKIVYTQSTGTAEFFVNGSSIGSSSSNIYTTVARPEIYFDSPIGSLGGTIAGTGVLIDYIGLEQSIAR